jgi:TonB-linked SusC/RagA family outer membrane protein
MRKHFFLLTIALLVFGVCTFAQQGAITGTVIADDGTPLPGATVLVKGTSNGVITDIDGNYSISVEGVTDPILVFSYVGYLNEEVPVGTQTQINTTLVANMVMVDEVVVVGYGTQKKSLVTGAISKVGADDLMVTQPQRVESALQGKIAGVTVSSASGSPGGSLTVRVRGTSSNGSSDPLYIVDGFKTGGIDYLDPADIESIEVLKDAASAAIYGAEGGNGVVYITTKKGKAGRTQVDYDFYYGTQRFKSKLELMDGNQYAEYFQKALTYETQARYPNETADQIEVRVNKALTTNKLPLIGEPINTNTNWIDEINAPAPVMSHHLNMSGGTEKTIYKGALSYYDQDGITGGSKAKFKRYSFDFNVEHKANNWLTVGANTTYSNRTRTSLSESEFGGVYANAIMLDPLTPTIYEADSSIPLDYLNGGGDRIVRNGDGKAYGMSHAVTNEVINPLAQIQNSDGRFEGQKIIAGAFGQIEPIKGLTFRSSINIDLANDRYENWVHAAYYHAQNEREISTNQLQIDKYYTTNFDNVLSYNKTIQKHTIGLMVGTHAANYEYERMNTNSIGMTREDDPFRYTSYGTVPDTATGTSTLSGSYRGDPERMASVFGRVTYNFDERYLLNVTMRKDGSSKLAPGHQYGKFPSYSLGWVVSNESFWNVAQINFFKLRYSYGTNGSLNNIRAFQYVPLIGFQGFPYVDGTGSRIEGAAPTQLSNVALSWEETKMYDVGLDMNFLANKFSLTVDYFRKTTTGLLTTAPTPAYVGNVAGDANAGDVLNTGLETELSYRKREGKFQFELSGNVSFLKNKVLYIGTQTGELDGANLFTGGQVTHIKEGEPIWYFYGYETNGLWADQAQIDEFNTYVNPTTGRTNVIQSNVIPGDVRIVDVNGDGIINTNDLTKIGSPHPDALMGLNFNAYYMNFDLGISIIGSFGNDIYSGLYRSDLGACNKPSYYLTDAWSPDNKDAEFYRPTLNGRWNTSHSSIYVQDGSYVKVKNVQIGYTLPKTLTEKTGIQRLRVYVSANNLLTFTKYKGADPEIGLTNNNDNRSNGVDRGYYPQSLQLTVGANVSF